MKTSVIENLGRAVDRNTYQIEGQALMSGFRPKAGLAAHTQRQHLSAIDTSNYDAKLLAGGNACFLLRTCLRWLPIRVQGF